MSIENDRKRLRALFFDFAIKRQQAAERVGQRFVYYTSAATALKILDSREIRMRSAGPRGGCVSRCLRIRAITAGSSMQAMIFSAAPQCSMSRLKTRFSRWT